MKAVSPSITVLVILLVSPFSAVPKDLFRTFDIGYAGKLIRYHVEDLNNDGRKDLLLLLMREDAQGRKRSWLSAFLQDSVGFRTRPFQEFSLPEQAILFDIGDVAGDQNKEFVYIVSGGVRYFSFTENGFDLTPHELFETESIFMLPGGDSQLSLDFVSDLNGDSRDEVYMPQIRQCDVYHRNPDDTWRRNTIPLVCEANYSGFYDSRFSVGARANAVYSTPYLLFQDMNADGRRDLTGVYRDSLVVFCQAEDGLFSATCHHNIPIRLGKIWPGAKLQRTRFGDESVRTFLMRIVDMNNDGVPDAVSTRISTEESIMNPETQVRIFFGKRDSTNDHGFYFRDEPDQIVTPGGTQIVLDVMDLNGDGRQDLVSAVVKVGLKNIISMLLSRSVDVQAETYLQRQDGLFPSKPDLKNRMVVRFTFRGGATSPVYDIADFNGDGFPDLLSSLEEKMLVIFWGSQKNIFGSSVGARINVKLPQDGEMVRAMHLNADGKADIVIHYNEMTRHKDLRRNLRIMLAN